MKLMKGRRAAEKGDLSPCLYCHEHIYTQNYRCRIYINLFAFVLELDFQIGWATSHHDGKPIQRSTLHLYLFSSVLFKRIVTSLY